MSVPHSLPASVRWADAYNVIVFGKMILVTSARLPASLIRRQVSSKFYKAGMILSAFNPSGCHAAKHKGL